MNLTELLLTHTNGVPACSPLCSRSFRSARRSDPAPGLESKLVRSSALCSVSRGATWLTRLGGTGARGWNPICSRRGTACLRFHCCATGIQRSVRSLSNASLREFPDLTLPNTEEEANDPAAADEATDRLTGS